MSECDDPVLSTGPQNFLTCTGVHPNGFVRTADDPRPRGSGGRAADRPAVPAADYLMRSKILKIGMYRAMIIDPMMPPSTAIISGSISAVRDSVVASTSWS
jgi:hypothetical protein